MANETVICTYRVRPDSEGQFARLLAEHWRTLRRLEFVTEEKTLAYRSLDDPPTVRRSSAGSTVDSNKRASIRTAFPSGRPWTLFSKTAAHSRRGTFPVSTGSNCRDRKDQGHRGRTWLASRRACPTSLTEAVFAALANQSRRTILMVLKARGGAMTSREIAARFDCSWPTTTRHLGVLEESGLVRVERRGPERIYTLDRKRLLAVAGGWLDRFRT